MEVIDIKNLFYFIVAIIWFVVSIYNKNRKSKKEEVKPKKKPIPNIFEEVVREFKKGIEEQVAPETTPQTKSQAIKKTVKKPLKKEIPEEVLAAQKRKADRELALKNSRNEKFEETENEGALLDRGYFQHDDLQKMVIFTEIFKRPNY
jgi:hypothetical protein